MSAVKRCHCDGRYEGCIHGTRCDNPPGTPWGPLFCAECDPRRLAHITANLEAMQASLSSSRVEGEQR